MRSLLAAFAAAILLVLVALTARPLGARAQEGATPAPAFSCDGTTSAAGTAMAGMDHGGMTETPMAGMEPEFDQAYIDMMIPHHQSIVAMAGAALSRLEDERLREIAQTVVDTQSAEIEELRGYREQFYGSPEPMPMDATTQMMPGMEGSMEEMAAQMDPGNQVALVCGAEDADLAFIDVTIPHHESAIAASEAALDQAPHEEIRAFAERVIEDQRREIDELSAVRQERYGSATPEAVEG